MSVGRGRFDGRAAIVTGAGSGIGAATAQRFAREGARVALLDVDAEPVEALAEQLTGEGIAAHAVVADVASPAAVARAVEEAEAELGPADVLVNNAGVVRVAPLHELPEELWDLQIDVNLKGAYATCRAVLPGMVARGGGVVVNVASVFASRGWSGVATYGASKGGIVALTKHLAIEYAPAVRVNCVSPGTTLTPGTEAGIAASPDPDGTRAALAASNRGIGRLIEAHEIAAAILFLASDDASAIVGHELVVGGGQGVAV